MRYIFGLFSTIVFEESVHLPKSENINRVQSARQMSDSDEDSMSSPLSDCSHEIK